MYSKVYSAGLNGLEAQKIIVEADVSGGLPSFQMVGLLASAVKEARERVRISLQNSGVIFPPKRITVNLSPADIRKDGSGFDLPIAISLVAAFGMIPISHTEHMAIAGELSLDGRVHGIHGALSMAIVARESGFSSVMLPTANVAEASFVEGIDVIGVQTLKEAIAYLRGVVRIVVINSLFPRISFNSFVTAGISLSYPAKKSTRHSTISAGRVANFRAVSVISSLVTEVIGIQILGLFVIVFPSFLLGNV